MSNVRVRFAPSPTGFFHIGSARTALFNWLYARHTGGSFILRIEDTDKERNTEEALQVILDGMKWLGLDWDEGPETGGNYGPYFQSERGAIYREYLESLKAKDRVYEKDGAIFFRLVGERYTEYDPFQKRNVEKVRTEPVVIEDAVRGRVERREEKDFVIFRANGEPVFHFVNVVDDITMGITHVVRGEDHLSNTSKHIELYNAFDLPTPVWAHIPLILKSSGSGKMSKRDKGALIEDYRKLNILPEALRNFLCLLGWNPKDHREVLPIEEIITLFDFPGINKDNARFDEKKLAFVNTEYIRQMPIDAFIANAKPMLLEAKLIHSETDQKYLRAVLELCQEKVRNFEDLPAYMYYFFSDNFSYNEKLLRKMSRKGDPTKRITELAPELKKLTSLEQSAIEPLFNRLAEENGVYPGEYIQAIRMAVSGSNAGPGIFPLMVVLGRDRILARIQRFVERQQ